nr:hypothetical protein [Tanacetum cinerariifolium]
MDTTIDQQVAMDEALVSRTQRLRIGRSNFRLLLDIKSKESTLQLVYDVLRLCPFFKAFLVTADVYEIYMQEFWVEHINHKKRNDMYYPRFTKVIIHHFMSKDLSIPRRNKVNWHYVRDDHMNSNAYKEYYAIATGAAPPKPKASVQRTRSSSDTSITPLTATVGPRLTTSQKGKQVAKAPKAKSLSALSEVAMTEAQQLKLVTKRSRQQTRISYASGFGADEGIGSIPGVPDVPSDESKEELSWNSTDDEGADDEGKDGDGDEEDDGDDGDDKDDEKDDEEEGGDDEQEYDEEEYDEETRDEESFDPILKTPKNSDDEGSGEEDLGLNVGGEERHAEELRTLEAKFSEFMQMNQFARAVSAIPEIVQRYMDQRMNEAVQKIIREKVKEQVNVQVSKILPRIEQTVNEQLEAEALVEAYESDKIILDTYRETVTLKRRRNDDADKDEEPSTRPDRGSKRCREGKDPESASAPTKTATRSTGRPPVRWKSPHIQSLTQVLKINQLCNPLSILNGFLNNRNHHLRIVIGIRLYQLDWVNPEGQQYPHNLLKPLPLIPNNRGRRVIPFEHFINNDLEYLRRGASSRKYTTSIMKTKAADYGHIKWIEDVVPRTMWIEEPIGYEKHALWGRRIIAVTELKIVEWHNYKHLDWITVRRDDDKLYKFKEGDFKRLRFQDIKDMLLLLRHVEDLQLGVESYQKKLNLTKPDSYRSDLKRKEAYTAYSNLRGFIYQNKDKKNRLMQIDEHYKFSDRTLTDVRTALDDRLKGIRMQYLPQSILRKSDKDRAAAMIQAIDKRLKTRRIMRSLERFVGGRLYEGDFRILQRTI